MNGLNGYPGNDMLGDLNIYSIQYDDEVYKAYVDAIIPRTPGLANKYGRIQYYGALDLYTDEYLMMSLNSLAVPIAAPTAQMLEFAAELFVPDEDSVREGASQSVEISAFGALSPTERLQVLAGLEQLQVNPDELPEPFRNNVSNILYIMGALSRFTLMGYYSEWSGYGSTRLEKPSQRRLEYFPLSWEQVGYPGPSLGYRALRTNHTGQPSL